MKMKLIKVTKKDSKRTDADADPILSKCIKNAQNAQQKLYPFRKIFHKDADDVEGFLTEGGYYFDTNKYKYLRHAITEVRYECQELLDVLNNYEQDIDKAYRENIRSVE